MTKNTRLVYRIAIAAAAFAFGATFIWRAVAAGAPWPAVVIVSVIAVGIFAGALRIALRTLKS